MLESSFLRPNLRALQLLTDKELDQATTEVFTAGAEKGRLEEGIYGWFSRQTRLKDTQIK